MVYVARNYPEETTNRKNAKEDNKASLLEQLPPQHAMIIGIIASMLIFCTIGFIILAISYFKINKI